jgi:transcriptional regulator with XRE-family HTH domain
VPSANAKSPDKIIGARLKMCRKREHISQTALGNHLGITFQQVQKYENGTNRVSAAKLFEIARFLNISVGELMMLDGHQPRTVPSRMHIARFATSPEGKDLIRGFLAIRDPAVRRQIVDLVEILGR